MTCNACEHFPAQWVTDDVYREQFCSADCARFYWGMEDIDRGLSPSKAAHMAHERTIKGHRITPKQRRYFYWVAGGRKKRKRKKP